jgi:hypothetical protein
VRFGKLFSDKSSFGKEQITLKTNSLAVFLSGALSAICIASKEATQFAQRKKKARTDL